MYMRLGVWKKGGYAYNFLKTFDHFFLKIYPPYNGGMGYIFRATVTAQLLYEKESLPSKIFMFLNKTHLFEYSVRASRSSYFSSVHACC